MTEELVETIDDPLLESDFVKEIVKQIRALDTHGVYDSKPAESLLKPFIVSKEQRKSIPIVGDPGREILVRIEVFYNTISALIEKECGLMASPLINLTYEGFGRVIIIVGKLVVADRALRDMHRFGFISLARMKEDADKLLSKALTLIQQHPDAANL